LDWLLACTGDAANNACFIVGGAAVGAGPVLAALLLGPVKADAAHGDVHGIGAAGDAARAAPPAAPSSTLTRGIAARVHNACVACAAGPWRGRRRWC
jgi:hypothetical protein